MVLKGMVYVWCESGWVWWDVGCGCGEDEWFFDMMMEGLRRCMYICIYLFYL